ncbi:hypothetical protein [Mesorhizobium sp.]|uniref:hypothetical protein n=1 Tax=Mesorhizobium sp. TaxID=1871066 RepID=UPI000FE68AD8|nr:hypothetical protein [Mesorhizobium sp.]RWO21443.1 MAG: hypothetical protein EOS09_23810 [Mesorhizobium sp.]
MAAPFQRFKHIVDIAETGTPESVLDIVRALLGCQEIVFEITEFKHAQWDAAVVPGTVNQWRQVAQAKQTGCLSTVHPPHEWQYLCRR